VICGARERTTPALSWYAGRRAEVTVVCAESARETEGGVVGSVGDTASAAAAVAYVRRREGC